VTVDTGRLKELIRDVPDFPRPGVVFKDITPLLADAEAFNGAVGTVAERFADASVTKVIGIEARGFIAAAPVACRLGAGFVPVRKAGKLPWHVEAQEYQLEYGDGHLEVHRDGVSPGDRVAIVDDVLATGGTAWATTRLVERLGGEVVGLAFFVELGFLGGRSRLAGREVLTLVAYE
jgi:adenine phosphoribosyltransferase